MTIDPALLWLLCVLFPCKITLSVDECRVVVIMCRVWAWLLFCAAKSRRESVGNDGDHCNAHQNDVSNMAL